MLPSRNILVVVVALVLSARAVSPSDVYDPDSIPQNEKLLRLLLRLASHTASRLIHLKKELRAKPRDSSTHVVPSVRMRVPDDQLTTGVLDEVLKPYYGNEEFRGPARREDHRVSMETRGNFRSEVNKSPKVGTKDSKVTPVEIASRSLFGVDDGNNNNNNNMTDKENVKNASQSSGSSVVKSETQKAMIRDAGGSGIANRTQNATSGSEIADQMSNVTSGLRSGGKSAARDDAHIAKAMIRVAGGSGIVNRIQNATSGSGIADQVPKVTSGLRSGGKSAVPDDAHIAKAMIREAGGSGIANRTHNATSGSGIADQVPNVTSGLRSGGKSPARDNGSPISNGGGSGILDQALNVTSGLPVSSIPGLTNATRVLGAKNVAQGIESMISNARRAITGSSIVQPKKLMGSVPLFRSFPDTQNEHSTPKKSSSDLTNVESSMRNGKTSKPSNEDKVSESELKGFALQFADALRPIESIR